MKICVGLLLLCEMSVQMEEEEEEGGSKNIHFLSFILHGVHVAGL